MVGARSRWRFQRLGGQILSAASTRLGSPRAQWILLGVAITFLITGTVTLATFPIDI
jgi:hypothetical protein